MNPAALQALLATLLKTPGVRQGIHVLVDDLLDRAAVALETPAPRPSGRRRKAA